MKQRLPFAQATWVIARRDFMAVLMSRAFLFFLLGPLFPIVVGMLAGGVTQSVNQTAGQAHIGIAMEKAELNAMLSAYHDLSGTLGARLPAMAPLKELAAGEYFDASTALAEDNGKLGAVLTGTHTAPRLIGTPERIESWRGPVALVASHAHSNNAAHYPEVTLIATDSSSAKMQASRLHTAQGAQTLLFLLIMLLAGMVLSNLVEEKTNKIIEVLASAIPMDAVFCGKLFAMLGVSMVGIAVWGATAGLAAMIAGTALPAFPEPALGWPLFVTLAIVYFGFGYLLLGAIFLTIGSMAATVREVQTLSMPVTMIQLIVFFFATYAMAKPGSTLELAAAIFPLSSPFAMVARAAQYDALWPHMLAIGWQLACTTLLIRAGAGLFRKKVMKSGPAARARQAGQQAASKRKGLSLLRRPAAG